MNILFVVPFAAPLFDTSSSTAFGGAEIRAWTLATLLAEHSNFSVTFMYEGRNKLPRHHLDGVTLNPVTRRRPKKNEPVIELEGCRFAARHLRPYINSKADLLVAFGASQRSAEIVAAGKLSGIKSLLFLASDADLDPDYIPNSRGHNLWGTAHKLCSLAVRQADFVIGQSSHQSALAKLYFNRDIAHLASPIPCSMRQASDIVREPFILWVGKSNDIKRPEIFLDLATKFADLPFVMVMNRDRQGLWEWINFQAPKNLEIIERLAPSQMDLLYEQAQLLVNTSRVEGFPVSFLQASEHRLPILSLVADPDAILSQHGGGVCLNGDIDKIDETFEHLWSDRENLRRLGENLHGYIARHHNPKDIAERLRDLASQILKKNRTQQRKQSKSEFQSLAEDKRHRETRYAPTRTLLFINFRPDASVPFGGGNIAVSNLLDFFQCNITDVEVTHDLRPDIDLYLVIDPHTGRHKSAGLDEIISYRDNTNPNVPILLRINDCDVTRPNLPKHLSREAKILEHWSKITWVIFNSEFIRNYYLELRGSAIPNCEVIYNGCDDTIFYPRATARTGEITKIVTHHWSSNVNKGYKTYLQLWHYCQHQDNLDFTFIGKNVPDFFSEVPIVGPLVKTGLAAALRDQSIYITDARNEACPNHVIEAIMTGLPVLFHDGAGGASELCNMGDTPLGESFSCFEDIPHKIEKIKKNYESYRAGAIRLRYAFEKKRSGLAYYQRIKVLQNLRNMSNRQDQATLQVLLCADEKYFVGLFACAYSVLSNTHTPQAVHFNFLIPKQDRAYFEQLLERFRRSTGFIVPSKIVYVSDAMVDPVIKQSRCIDGGGHLNNLANYSRLLASEFFQHDKLLYLDSDSIVNCDLVEKLASTAITGPLAAIPANLKGRELRLASIIDTDHDWTSILGDQPSGDDCAFMGAPLLINCKQWCGLQPLIKRIVLAHNRSEKGLYKLFTMSLQNLAFYNETGDLSVHLNCLADCGSAKKVWTESELQLADILDWSGNLKPWFVNGLNRSRWIPYDILGLSNNMGWTSNERGDIETFQKTDYHDLSEHVQFTSAATNFAAHSYIYRLIEAGRDWSGKGLKLLYVMDAAQLICKMSRVRFWAIEALAAREDISLEFCGPGMPGWNSDLSLQDNISSLKTDFDFVLWYKPLATNNAFDVARGLPFPTAIFYNEMWDENATRSEIEASGANLVVCHHSNDHQYYSQLYARDVSKRFVHIPHSADTSLFYDTDTERDIDILLVGRPTGEHYPLRERLHHLIDRHSAGRLRQYRIHTLDHPGYTHDDAFTNRYQKEFAALLRRSKLVCTCASKHKYRLGKYIEIPMSGAVICADLPEGDEHSLDQFIAVINLNMTDNQILDVVDQHLENKELLAVKALRGKEWAESFSSDWYANGVVSELRRTINQCGRQKVYVIADEIPLRHTEFNGKKWICDTLKSEFSDSLPENVTLNAAEADVIWYLAPWNIRHVPSGFTAESWKERLLSKDVVMTLHHIDETKLASGAYDSILAFMRQYGSRYHAICRSTYEFLKRADPDKPIQQLTLWVNTEQFFPLRHQSLELRQKWALSADSYLIGSFQKDTEGMARWNCPSCGQSNGSSEMRCEDTTCRLRRPADVSFEYLPKLSKGPDIFMDVVVDMQRQHPNLEVVLTGLRRHWLCNELKKKGIPYHYFEMVDLSQVNELYACLDLYIVASRFEGGPRALFEAGATLTPVISTDVGVATALLSRDSIWDAKVPLSYRTAKANVEAAAEAVSKLSISNHIHAHATHILGAGRTRVPDRHRVDESPATHFDALVAASESHLMVVEANLLDANTRVDIPEDKLVVIARRGIRVFESSHLTAGCLNGNDLVAAYLIDNPNDKELALVIHSASAASHTIGSLIERATYNPHVIIGCNTSSFLDHEVLAHYWLMGRFNLDFCVQPFFKLRDEYHAFLDSEDAGTLRYSEEILKRVYAFRRGQEKQQLDANALKQFLSRHSENLTRRKCLVASKFLEGYGGNQRVALQMIDLLAREFDVYVWSVSQPTEQQWDYEQDRLHPDVHNRSIIKLKGLKEIAAHVDNAGYQLIVNNKSHEFLEIHKQITQIQSIVITHNSMDPFNGMVLKNQRLFDLVLTVGGGHEKRLRKNGLTVPSNVFINSTKSPLKPLVRPTLKRRLVFVGRLSDEKGLPLLLGSFQLARSRLLDIDLELEVIGDGPAELMTAREGVHFLGRLTHNEIWCRLVESDFLVLPSSTEGMPFAVLDALAAGIPCICSNIEGVNEVVSHKVNGLLFELEGYAQHKDVIDQWLTADSVRRHFNTNVERLAACIIEACGLTLDEWHQLSLSAQKSIANTHAEHSAKTLNLKLLEPFLQLPTRKKLLICTAAIPRGTLHEASLGAFYQQYRHELATFEVHHIIHLDDPHALKSSFSADETEKLLQQLIPPSVHLKIIRSKKSSFVRAYKKLMRAITDLELLDDNTWVWWLEDDWAPTGVPSNFLSLISALPASENYALGLAADAHLGSFRGGPLMSAAYFQAFFDIQKKGLANDTCDPEKQVRRWLSGKNEKNGDQQIYRRLGVDASDKHINILHVMEEMNPQHTSAINRATSYYKHSDNFHSSIDFTGSLHYFDSIKSSSAQCSASAMNHVMVHPPPFRDIGRAFNTRQGLRKWKTPADGTTYLDAANVDARIPIAIATTAINRPALHQDTLASWLAWLEHFDEEQFAVKWFINIDIIPALGAGFSETRETLEKAIDGRFEVEFINEGSASADFLGACQRLSESVNSYLQLWGQDVSSYVIWLEDDWRFNTESSINPNVLIDLYGTSRSAICLSYIRENYIWALAPSIISFALFKELHLAAWRQQDDFADPEHVVGLYYRKTLGDPKDMPHLTVINKSVNSDFFKQPHMSSGAAKYVAHNDSAESDWPLARQVTRASIKATWGERPSFIRITPSMCEGGADIGRKFMLKYGLKKSKEASAPDKFYE